MTKDVLRITILGCGSSGGVPRIGGSWGACDPANPKNRRRRCSALVERFKGGDETQATRVLVDASPDLREQLLGAGVGELDGVLFTHGHADHCHGLDDLRVVVYIRRQKLPVWADADTAELLMDRFRYAFVQPQGSPYPPILEMRRLDGPVAVDGAGGSITAAPYQVIHGGIHALGFRFGPVGYTPDISEMTEEAWAELEGVDTWIVDALRYKPHPTHAHLERTLGWIERLAPRRAVITNMHVDLDYDAVTAETPDHVVPAFDGLALDFTI